MTVVTVRDAAVDADLARREEVIERGLRTFLDVGRELTAIGAQRLYYQDYSTFEDYCQDRWSFSPSRAYRLMDAAQTVDAMSPIGDTPLPANEGQARALTGLTPEVAAEVMVKAHESGGKVTAKTISEAREEVAPKPEPAKAEPIPEPTPAADPPPVKARRTQQPVLEGDALAKYDAEKACENFGFALGSLEGLMVPEHRARVLQAWKTGALGATPHNRELHTPATIRHLADALITYAAEMELANV